MDDSRNKIRSFVGDLITRKGFSAKFTDDTKLVSNGFLDSIDIMDIVVYLEQEFSLDFIDRGIDQTEFDSVNSIIQMIEAMS